MPVAQVLVLILAVGCAWFDIRTRKIPNRLTLPLIALGLFLSALSVTETAWWSSVLSVVTTMTIGFFISQAGFIGGGDVKMIAAIGALVGHQLLLESILWTAMIGGVVSLFLLASRRALVPFLRRLLVAGYTWFRWGVTEPVVEGEGHRIPFGVIIALGTIAAVAAESLAFEWIRV